MSDAEFGRLRPRQLEVLLNRIKDETEILDRRTALICMVIANCHVDKKKKKFKIEDFMPKKQKASKKINRSTNPDEIRQMFRLWNAAVGGKEKLDAN